LSPGLFRGLLNKKKKKKKKLARASKLRAWIASLFYLFIQSQQDGDCNCFSTANHWHPNVNSPRCRNGRETIENQTKRKKKRERQNNKTFLPKQSMLVNACVA
jgi:hypothetical protein